MCPHSRRAWLSRAGDDRTAEAICDLLSEIGKQCNIVVRAGRHCIAPRDDRIDEWHPGKVQLRGFSFTAEQQVTVAEDRRNRVGVRGVHDDLVRKQTRGLGGPTDPVADVRDVVFARHSQASTCEFEVITGDSCPGPPQVGDPQWSRELRSMSTSQCDGPCGFVCRNGLQRRAHSSPGEFVGAPAWRSRMEVDPQSPVLHRSRQNRKVSCGAVHRNCERDRPQFSSVSSEQYLVGQLDETRSRDEHVAAERRKTHSSPGPLEKPCTELLLESGDASTGHRLWDPSGGSSECHAAEFADSGECSTGVYQVHHLMVCAIGMRADVSVFDCMAEVKKTVHH